MRCTKTHEVQCQAIVIKKEKLDTDTITTITITRNFKFAAGGLIPICGSLTALWPINMFKPLRPSAQCEWMNIRRQSSFSSSESWNWLRTRQRDVESIRLISHSDGQEQIKIQLWSILLFKCFYVCQHDTDTTPHDHTNKHANLHSLNVSRRQAKTLYSCSQALME